MILFLNYFLLFIKIVEKNKNELKLNEVEKTAAVTSLPNTLFVTENEMRT